MHCNTREKKSSVPIQKLTKVYFIFTVKNVGKRNIYTNQNTEKSWNNLYHYFPHKTILHFMT